MKLTLLQIVQMILSDLDGDEVNSIGDTVESLQIANFVKESYIEMLSGLNLPATQTLFQLNPSGDNTKPVVMYLPDVVSNLRWIKYDTQLLGDPGPDYKEVCFLSLDKFLERQNMLDQTQSNVAVLDLDLDLGTFFIPYLTDRHPMYYAVLEDQTLVFDSHLNTLDTTLQAAKTMCFGEKTPEFRMEDSFVPTLEPKQFSLLLNEAKSQSFVESKQTQSPVAERRARKGWVRTQREKIVVPSYENLKAKTKTNFGRI